MSPSDASHAPQPRSFEPKEPVSLPPPKSDPISVDYLSKCDGKNAGYPTLVAIKGIVYDVTGNSAYSPPKTSTDKGGAYHVFAGKDASRALATTSVKPEDVRPEWADLSDKEKQVLQDWVTFFSKRYAVVGKVVGGKL